MVVYYKRCNAIFAICIVKERIKKLKKSTENNPTDVLNSMMGVVAETKNNVCNRNELLEPVTYRFDYPLPINNSGMCLRVHEYLL